MPCRNVTEEVDPQERFGLYRLCDCPTCEGKGKAWIEPGNLGAKYIDRCPDCRGEGRIRQEVASCASPEAVGVALVTLAREGEWEECPLGLLDRMPECDHCEGSGEEFNQYQGHIVNCVKCKGSGIKSTGTWLILPWVPSARNVRDAARTLARSKKSNRTG